MCVNNQFGVPADLTPGKNIASGKSKEPVQLRLEATMAPAHPGNIKDALKDLAVTTDFHAQHARIPGYKTINANLNSTAGQQHEGRYTFLNYLV